MSIFDGSQIIQAQQQEQMARERRELIEMIQATRQQFEQGCQRGFDKVWGRGSKEEIQAFLDQFSVEEQQEIFSNHLAAMQFLARFPGFTPQVPPYELEWTEDGILVGEKKPLS